MRLPVLLLVLFIAENYGACPKGYVPMTTIQKYANGETYEVCEQPQRNGNTYFMSSSGNVNVTKRMFDMYVNESTAWMNFGKSKVLNSEEDLLGNALLAKGDKLTYEEVQAAIPPIAPTNGNVHTFTGTREALVDLAIGVRGGDPGGLGIPNPGVVLGKKATLSGVGVKEGMLGGFMPLIVFQYPDSQNANAYWEWTVVPYVDTNGNHEVPAMFRAVNVITDPFKEHLFSSAMYFDRYLYSAGDLQPDAQMYYSKILDNYFYWQKAVADEKLMTVNIPTVPGIDGSMLRDQGVHTLVRDMITRQEKVWPRYGVQPGYGGFGNNGFQEIFTASMMESLEWSSFEYAGGVLANYLENYLRYNGSVAYRGLEMAQSCRTLTNVAQYYWYTGDPTGIIPTYYNKINGIVDMMNRKRAASLKLNASSPAYGMPQGNDEADLWWSTVNHQKTQEPFFSIAAEMWRGFRDLSQVYLDLGEKLKNPKYTTQGKSMETSADALYKDLQTSLSRSLVHTKNPKSPICYPYVAGNPTCDKVSGAVSDRDSEPWRTQSEAMYSGAMPKTVVDTWYTWNSLNSKMQRIGTVSGTGASCCGNELMTFTSHGFGYGLLQYDMVDRFILNYYAQSAHAYTRGTWTAPESADIDRTKNAVSYCSPSETTAGILLKWMFLHEDPMNHIVWLGKALPKMLFQPGETISISGTSSYYGIFSSVTWTVISPTQVNVAVVPPVLNCAPSNIGRWGNGGCPAGGIYVRVRTSTPISSVTVGGKPWADVDKTTNTIRFPASNLTASTMSGMAHIVVNM